MYKSLRIAVTGATGFVGRHLLEDIDVLKYNIRIISRQKEKVTLSGNIEVAEADLTNYNSLRDALNNIDVVVNLAAEVRNVAKMEETNILGTKNLIHAAIENKVSKIIHLSSVGVVGMQYSKTPVIVDEVTNCFPKNKYEQTKLDAENLLLKAHREEKFKLTILRPTNVFGEYHPYNALLNLIQHINEEKPFACTASAVVNYTYVKDLTALIIYLIDSEEEYGIVNIGAKRNLKNFVRIIADELDKKVKQHSMPQFLVNFIELLGIKKLRSVYNNVEYSDNKLKAFYNYPYDINVGIKRMIEFYKRKNLIK